MTVARSGNFGKVSVTTAATLIAAQDDNRTSIILLNEGSTDCRIGTTNSVTAGGANDGILLQAGASLSLKNYASIYAITASGSTTISYISNKII